MALSGGRISIKTPSARFGTVKGRGGRIRVDGLSEVLRRLKFLPPKIQRKVMRSAIAKACTPVVREARKTAPVGEGLNPDGSERKHLNQTMTKRVKTYGNGNVVGIIGPKGREAPHAKLVELGTSPHDIVLGKPLNLGKTTLPVGYVIHHPGAKASHFLERALDNVRGQVQDVMEIAVGVGIEREAAKLAGMR
jgi:HK97 gp10 family phage protein